MIERPRAGLRSILGLPETKFEPTVATNDGQLKTPEGVTGGFFNVAVPEAGAPIAPDPRPSACIRGCLMGLGSDDGRVRSLNLSLYAYR